MVSVSHSVHRGNHQGDRGSNQGGSYVGEVE